MLKRLMSGPVLSLILGLLSGLAIGASNAALADEPGTSEIHVSLDESRHVWIVPSIALTRMTLDYGGTSTDPGPHGASGTQLGVQMIASSNRTRSLLVGLDLRQILAETDGYRGANVLGTKLGVRVEWRPEIRFRPGIGAAYFFGDTIVAHDRDRQFNGQTASLFIGVDIGSARWFIEGTSGAYAEGPGFVLLARAPGSDTMNYRSVELGVSFPIWVLWPTWLRMSPPPPSPVTPY